MFRYIAISLSPLDAQAVETADRLEMQLQAAPGWKVAFSCKGLRIYITGDRPGVNGVYQMPSQRGVVLGRLFRRTSAGSSFENSPFTGDEAHRIVHTCGKALLDDYWGRYVAFLPTWHGDGRVLRDPTGALPCYQTQFEGVSIAFSWLEDLFDVLQLPQVFTIDWDALAAIMLLRQLGGQATALKEVRQILPGELATLGRDAHAPQFLWSAVEIAGNPIERSPSDAADLLRQTVRDCALAWASCYEALLLRLSGGVDSSILLNSLCPAIPPERVTCINYYSAGPDSDERSYARLAASRCGTKLIEQHRDESFALESMLDVARTPTPGSYLGRMATGRLDAAAAVSHGARAVFTGSNGDQLFFEARRTWPAADYLKLHGLGSGFLRAALESAKLGQVSFWRSACDAIKDQWFRGNSFADLGRYVTLLSEEGRLLAGRQIPQSIHPILLAHSELPIGKYHQVDALICPGEYYDPYLRDASPELVMPLRSQPLLEYCLSTPTYTLTLGGRGRGLARKAFAQDIPPEISTRRSKGSTQDHVTAVLRRCAPFARELLLDGHLARRGLLNRVQLETALSGRPTTTQTYATEIHACIAIEAWVRCFS